MGSLSRSKRASVKGKSVNDAKFIKLFDFNGLNGVNWSVDWLCSLGSGRLDNSKQSCQSYKLCVIYTPKDHSRTVFPLIVSLIGLNPNLSLNFSAIDTDT